ncbi:hypothetical protein RYA07_23720 [Pseudomonas syringae pv. actinidiae]|nr:hypothetical protein [Pseudomonas syringae pv. actinidiae]
MAITTVLNTKIGEARKVARLWLEGSKLAHAGVKIGARYSIAAHRANNRIELREVDERYQGNTFTVSSRTLNGVVRPLFEIRTNVLREVFENVETVRVAIYPQFVSLGVVLGKYLRGIAANADTFVAAA